MKHIVLIGGSGTIGTILYHGLKNSYRITVLDLQEPKSEAPFIKTDASNLQQLSERLPADTDVIVNLLKIETSDRIEQLDEMIDVYFKASCYILHTAAERGIPKVVFASSNHVTDIYEENGRSKLGRPIRVTDYPYSKGMYGTLKLASENVGRIISQQHGVSVMNLRIGSVPPDQEKALREDERLMHTLLTREDVVHLFQAAIESNLRFGTFYGVSSNPDKPWDTTNAEEQLGFRSVVNTSDLTHATADRL
ncbi:NAD-dependent epimerase/dehydratase family protein [Paenibacillus turpanensis]|uniref:NAD-dependent epimerase/dehydratase family protein n=1 Tax=Paenibacillus turpanensis TaxID=2689078 RepID=UPI001407696D|nr:NAD(P)-dependent oxidoreductase [Paenibacillus turpanensis]